jgi:hypothetical protein
MYKDIGMNTSNDETNKFDFELKVPHRDKSLELKFSYCLGDTPGFNVTTLVNINDQYAAFLPLASVREYPPLSPDGFRSYVTRFVLEDCAVVTYYDKLIFTIPGTDFLGEIKITLAKPRIDSTEVLPKELALVREIISELQHRITKLEGLAELPGPSFRYDISSGAIHTRSCYQIPVQDILFNFVREDGFVKRICEEYGKAKGGTPMSEHFESLRSQKTLENFKEYLKINLSLTISIRCIIEALAFNGIVVSEKTQARSLVDGSGSCIQPFHDHEFWLTIPSGLVISINGNTMPAWGVIDFETVMNPRKPRVVSIEYADVTKLKYPISPDNIVRKFEFGCPGSDRQTYSCGCRRKKCHMIQITYALNGGGDRRLS